MEAADVWMMLSAALVLFMIPGLALFYGGMVRSKNVLNMLLMNLYCAGIIPILWVVFGASVALYGTGEFIGGFDAVGLKDVDGPTMIFIIYTMTFAAITPALIAGAVADRMKFLAWAIFVPVWSALVYLPVTFWLYGYDSAAGELVGWLGARGSLDFAGGTAIHINAGVAALALTLVIGKRKGWPKEPMPPHNLTLVLLGTGILWFGWFGFNSGGAAYVGAGLTVTAMMNTFLAASAGMLSWLIAERIKDGHFTTLGAASGIVAGLVAITPAAGFVGGLAGIAFGAVAGVVCFAAIQLKYKLGYDDSLDVVGIHMVGGIIGGVLIGFFADTSILGREGGEYMEGLFFGGGTELLVEQVLAIVVVLIFSFVVTTIIARAIDMTIGLRVTEEAEDIGLDRSEHGETAYSFAELN